MCEVQTRSRIERKMKRQGAGALLLALVCATAVAGSALAHQPFFENPDTTASTASEGYFSC